MAPLLAGQAPDRFSEWDADKNGKLTPEELPLPLQPRFARVDRDGNGFISREEHETMRQAVGAAKGGGANQDGKGATPEGVRLLADLDYTGADHPRQKLDLLLPEKSTVEGKPLPVIVFIHGGGWQNGDKIGGRNRVSPFVESGKYAGVSVGYRLSGEAIWPAQLHDCKAAIRWVRAHAAEHGLDPERIAVWGTSAGGHLAAMLGTTNGEASEEGALGPHTGISSKVAVVVDFFGPSDLGTMGGHHNNADSPESKLIGATVPEHPDKARAASPLTWAGAGDPPFLIIHGDEDPVVPYAQSTDLDKKLRAAGVPVCLITVKGAGHGKGFGPGVTTVVTQFLAHRFWGEGTAPVDGALKAGE